MKSYRQVATLSELTPGSRKVVDVDGILVALFNIEGKICAIEDLCTHDGGTLAEGDMVAPGVIACPRHGAQFNVCTGQALTLPAFEAVDAFDVKVEDDTIYVESPF